MYGKLEKLKKLGEYNHLLSILTNFGRSYLTSDSHTLLFLTALPTRQDGTKNLQVGEASCDCIQNGFGMEHRIGELCLFLTVIRMVGLCKSACSQWTLLSSRTVLKMGIPKFNFN